MAVNFLKKNTRSLLGKVVLALLLAAIAILLSWAITRLTFMQVLSTVKKLSISNPKLELVNRIFVNVVKLDQLQRVQSLEPKAAEQQELVNESARIRLMLDSLHALSFNDTEQVLLVVSMKELLHKRDELYLNYLTKQSEYISNDVLNKKIQSLKELVNNPVYNIDSNIVKTESKKIITTTILPADDRSGSNKSLLGKLFSKKKPPEQPKQQIKEEVNITTDTMQLANVDTNIIQLSETIATAEITRSNERRSLINKQLELNRMGSVFISRLLEILNQMEREETDSVEQSNAAATIIVNRNLWRMNVLIIVFIVGAAVLTFLILTDIIKSNRYKKELILAKEEAEELGQVKQRFLANMSHELRTPLQAIVGMAEQVNIRGKAEEKDINMIYQSSQHLLQIVNEVLDYSLITSGKFKMEDKVFSLADILDEVKNVIQVKANQKNLDLIYEPVVMKEMKHVGDPFRLKQILYNLLGNAVKFTDNGSVTFRTEQKNFNAYSIVTFTIKDTGYGIAKEDVQKIFNQFEQGSAPSSLQQQGTGLGLSIVQTLIDTLKGNVKVESELGKGSVFTVTIPYTIAKNSEAPKAKVIQAAVNTQVDEVWVIDDDPLILQLCDFILSKYNLKHTCFSDPYEMLKRAKTYKPDIVLMDIRMPLMSGFELLQKIKPYLPESTKVFALTAHALPEDREEILRPGFNDMLMKPFMEGELLGILGIATVNEPTTKTDTNGLEVLRKMTGGDEVLLQQILKQFTEETLKDNASFLESIENSDLQQAAEHLHKMAGRLGQVGIKDTSKKLRTAEVKIRNNDTDSIVPTLQELHTEVAAAIVHIQGQINPDL